MSPVLDAEDPIPEGVRVVTIACPPVDARKYTPVQAAVWEVVVGEPEVPDGSVESLCAMCGIAVWLRPRSRAAKESFEASGGRGLVLCFVCAVLDSTRGVP